jgi:hypothetical protein
MNRYQRQSGSTLMARLRDDLAEVLTSEGASLSVLKACEAGVLQ